VSIRDILYIFKNLQTQNKPFCNVCKTYLERHFQLDLFLCLTACLLQREVVDYTRVLEYSLKVLHWRAGDIKALYRAGVASLELGDAPAARQYLIQATRGKPNGKNQPYPTPFFVYFILF